MSIKAKSKPASATSPEPGSPSGAAGTATAVEAEGHGDKTDKSDAKAEGKAKGRGESVTVYLASDRNRRVSWMLFGCVLGGLLLWKFGTVAAAIGLLLLAIGLYHGWFFAQTLMHEPGAVSVDAKQVTLPRGLCRGTPERLAASALTSAYFLRRAVPWNRSAPVLVIEADGRAFVYPRDWFSSEADQRRIMHAVLPLIAQADGGEARAAAE